MRRILTAAVLAAAVASTAACGMQEPPAVSPKVQAAYETGKTLAPSPKPVDILAPGRADGNLSTYFIGDSLTDGWNATAQPKAFRPLLTAALQKKGKVTATATYKAGATLAEVSQMVDLPQKPELVVLELGTNDVNKTQLRTFEVALDDLLDRVMASKPALVCVGTWQFGTTQGFDAVIKAACEERGGRFVRIGDLRETPSMVAPKGTAAYPAAADGAHPNDAGHAEIARRLAAALEL